MNADKQLIVSFIKDNANLFYDHYDPDRLEKKVLRRIELYEEDRDLYEFEIFEDELRQLSREDLNDSEKEIVRSIAIMVDLYLKSIS